MRSRSLILGAGAVGGMLAMGACPSGRGNDPAASSDPSTSTGSVDEAGSTTTSSGPDTGGDASSGSTSASSPTTESSSDDSTGTPEDGPPVENDGLDCPVSPLADPAALPRIDRLPDPFTKLDGSRLSSRREWRCRRQEIHAQAEKYIYGEKPPKPEIVTGSVTNDRVAVDVESGGASIHFEAEIVLPATGQAPYPAIINLGARGGFGGITLGESFILEQGVAKLMIAG